MKQRESLVECNTVLDTVQKPKGATLRSPEPRYFNSYLQDVAFYKISSLVRNRRPIVLWLLLFSLTLQLLQIGPQI